MGYFNYEGCGLYKCGEKMRQCECGQYALEGVT
jgi:hypothetical protein